MKLLYVYGDNDYSAMIFCDDLRLDNKEDLKRLWNKAKENGGETVLLDDENDEYEIYCRACEFGEVDPKFIEWIKNDIELLDYDESKARDFFIVED